MLKRGVNMREVLQQTAGRIKSDEQMQALNEIMTRGLMLSVGGWDGLVGDCSSGDGLGGRCHLAPEIPSGGRGLGAGVDRWGGGKRGRVNQ